MTSPILRTKKRRTSLPVTPHLHQVKVPATPPPAPQHRAHSITGNTTVNPAPSGEAPAPCVCMP